MSPTTTTTHPSAQYPGCVVCDNCGGLWKPVGVVGVRWRIWGTNAMPSGTIDLRTTCPGCGLGVSDG